MKVTVTQAHIDEARKLLHEGDQEFARPSVTTSCPIALALGEGWHAYYGWVDHWDEHGVRDREFGLPLDAVDFMVRFDGRKSVEPFEFELERSRRG